MNKTIILFSLCMLFSVGIVYGACNETGAFSVINTTLTGCYFVTGNITVTNGVNILNFTNINLTFNSTDTQHYGISLATSGSSASYVTFQNATVSGTNKTAYAIIVGGADNRVITLNNSYFNNIGGTNRLQFFLSRGDVFIYNNIFNNISGLYIYKYDTAYRTYVVNNTINDFLKEGIYMDRHNNTGSGYLIQDNILKQASDGDSHSIDQPKGMNGLVKNNIIYQTSIDNKGINMRTNVQRNITIINNTINATYSYAGINPHITVHDLLIENNTLIGRFDTAGISFDHSSLGTVKGNTINLYGGAMTSGRGIEITNADPASSSINFTDNTIINSTTGIWINNLTYSNISNNVINGSTTSLYYIDGISNIQITNNTINGRIYITNQNINNSFLNNRINNLLIFDKERNHNLTYNYTGSFSLNMINSTYTFVQQQNQYPYDDIKNITTDTIIHNNVDNETITMLGGVQYNIQNYTPAGGTGSGTITVTQSENPITDGTMTVTWEDTNTYYGGLNYEIYMNTTLIAEDLHMYTQQSDYHTCVNTCKSVWYLINRTQINADKIQNINYTTYGVGGVGGWDVSTYTVVYYTDSTSTNGTQSTYDKNTHTYRSNITIENKDVDYIDTYIYRTGSSGYNAYVNINYEWNLSTNTRSKTINLLPYNLTIGEYMINLLALDENGTLVKNGTTTAFNYSRNNNITLNIYKYGTYDTISNANITLTLGSTSNNTIMNSGGTIYWINGTSTINITSTGYQDYNSLITTTPGTGTYSVYMLPQRSLTFSANTTVKLAAQTLFGTSLITLFGTRTWNNINNIVLVNETLADGLAQMVFNGVSTYFGIGNHTQYYEWIVDGNSETFAENVTLINTTDVEQLHIEVSDCLLNKYLTDVKIRLYGGIGNQSNMTEMPFLGQRYTDTYGKTFFFIDRSYINGIELTKEGYPSVRKILLTDDNGYDDISAPLQLCMNLNTTDKIDNIGIISSRPSTSSNINIILSYWGMKTLRYSTTYLSLGGVSTNSTIRTATKYTTEDQILRNAYYINLTTGSDYLSTNTQFTLNIFLDDTLYAAYIFKDQGTVTDMFPITTLEGSTDEENGIIVPILWVMLIVLILGVEWLFRDGTADISAIGTHMLFIGGIILYLINSAFLLLAVVSGLYYALRFIKSLLTE